MAQYVYPAVFTAESDGGFSVDFPDLESCYTCGDNLAEAIKMAEDVLALTLYEYERDNKQAPTPTAVDSIKKEQNEFVNYVAADTLYYQRRFNSKAVKKTLTIPEWLNNLATAEKLNFSQILQDALASRLNVQL